MPEVVNVKEKKAVFTPCVVKPRNPVETFTPLGETTYRRAKLSFDKDGEKVAEPGEVVPLDAIIQASRASTDIAVIVEKVMSGDTSVINVGTGYFGDTVVLPKNVNDVMALNALSDKALEGFNSLPDDVRALFDNDPTKFLKSVIENKALDVIKAYEVASAEKTKPTEDVVSDPEGGN